MTAQSEMRCEVCGRLGATKRVTYWSANGNPTVVRECRLPDCTGRQPPAIDSDADDFWNGCIQGGPATDPEDLPVVVDEAWRSRIVGAIEGRQPAGEQRDCFKIANTIAAAAVGPFDKAVQLAQEMRERDRRREQGRQPAAEFPTVQRCTFRCSTCGGENVRFRSIPAEAPYEFAQECYCVTCEARGTPMNVAVAPAAPAALGEPLTCCGKAHAYDAARAEIARLNQRLDVAEAVRSEEAFAGALSDEVRDARVRELEATLLRLRGVLDPHYVTAVGWIDAALDSRQKGEL